LAFRPWTGLTWGLVAGNNFWFEEGWVRLGSQTTGWTDLLWSCSWECLLGLGRAGLYLATRPRTGLIWDLVAGNVFWFGEAVTRPCTGLTWGLVAGNDFWFGDGYGLGQWSSLERARLGNQTADWSDLWSCSWE
jgi:hypothetical protein